MISHIDGPFEIQVKKNGVLNSYLVTPLYYKKQTEATFAVSIDGKDLGKLKRHTIKRWVWEEGKAEQNLADDIGLKIDEHFN